MDKNKNGICDEKVTLKRKLKLGDGGLSAFHQPRVSVESFLDIHQTSK